MTSSLSYLLTNVRNGINFQISTNKLSICITMITIHDETRSQIICLTKTEGLLLSILSFIWKGLNKDAEAKQLIKPWPNRMKPREIRLYLKWGNLPAISFKWFISYWKTVSYGSALDCFVILHYLLHSNLALLQGLSSTTLTDSPFDIFERTLQQICPRR